jgi:hypothetical protein
MMDEGQVFVKFGPRDTQEIALGWAEFMLTQWAARKPVEFGKLLAEAALAAR